MGNKIFESFYLCSPLGQFCNLLVSIFYHLNMYMNSISFITYVIVVYAHMELSLLKGLPAVR